LTGRENIRATGLAPSMLAPKPALPTKAPMGFRDPLECEPGRYQYGSASNGSTGHIAAALLLH
jgi:tripartite-type tricarboxylate transporter receptor subunit TctC